MKTCKMCLNAYEQIDGMTGAVSERVKLAELMFFHLNEEFAVKDVSANPTALFEKNIASGIHTCSFSDDAIRFTTVLNTAVYHLECKVSVTGIVSAAFKPSSQDINAPSTTDAFVSDIKLHDFSLVKILNANNAELDPTTGAYEALKVMFGRLRLTCYKLEITE